jgi:hypothetical protein
MKITITKKDGSEPEVFSNADLSVGTAIEVRWEVYPGRYKYKGWPTADIKVYTKEEE